MSFNEDPSKEVSLLDMSIHKPKIVIVFADVMHPVSIFFFIIDKHF